jgi:hypothetical protein
MGCEDGIPVSGEQCMTDVDAADKVSSAAVGSYISGTADLDDYTNSANDVEDCGC